MLDNFVCDITAIGVTIRATGHTMYGAYRRHDRKAVTIYGMVCGEPGGDKMEEKSFNLADVDVEIVGQLQPKG